MEALSNATYEELLAAPEVGEIIARSVVDFFADAGNRKEIQRLRVAGLQFVSEEKEPERLSEILAGKSFVISGTFENYERDQLGEIIQANGGKLLSSVSGKLDFLLAGDNMGPAKREKAESWV